MKLKEFEIIEFFERSKGMERKKLKKRVMNMVKGKIIGIMVIYIEVNLGRIEGEKGLMEVLMKGIVMVEEIEGMMIELRIKGKNEEGLERMGEGKEVWKMKLRRYKKRREKYMNLKFEDKKKWKKR